MTILPKKKLAKEKSDSESSQYHHHRLTHHHHHGLPSVASVPVSSHPPWHQYSTTVSTQHSSRRHMYSSVATSSIPSSADITYGMGLEDCHRNLHWTPERLSPLCPEPSSSLINRPCSTNGGVMKRKRRRDPLASSSTSFCKSLLSTSTDNPNIVKHCSTRPLERISDSHEVESSNLENQPLRKPPDNSVCASNSTVASPPHNNSEDEYENSNEVTDQERELRFERMLKAKKGFLVKKMKEDGACLFRAISDQIYGDQDMHSIIRNHVCDYMLKNRDFFQQFVTEDFTRYIERKRVDSAHGNHVELQAISEMYNRPIEIYIYNAEPANVLQSSYGTDNPPIRLSYHNNMHYNSVVDPYAATVGVGLGLPSFNPGLAEKSLMKDALGTSENFFIEQAMYEDKLRATDWEATNDAINEAVIRESRLQFLRDQEKQRALNMPPKQPRSPTHMGISQSSEYSTQQQGSKQQQTPSQFMLTSATATRSKPSSPAHSPASTPNRINNYAPAPSDHVLFVHSPSSATDTGTSVVTSASSCSSKQINPSAAGGECSQSRGRQSPVATRCSMGSSVAAPVGNNGSPRPSPGGQQSPPQQSQISMTSAIPSTSPRPQHSFTDESSHAPMTSSNTSPSVYYVSDCPSFFPQGLDPSNQEYLLMRALMESQLDYYNSLRMQSDSQPSRSSENTSPKPGPSSAAS